MGWPPLRVEVMALFMSMGWVANAGTSTRIVAAIITRAPAVAVHPQCTNAHNSGVLEAVLVTARLVFGVGRFNMIQAGDMDEWLDYDAAIPNSHCGFQRAPTLGLPFRRE